jgi:hypothetical protein
VRGRGPSWLACNGRLTVLDAGMTALGWKRTYPWPPRFTLAQPHRHVMQRLAQGFEPPRAEMGLYSITLLALTSSVAGTLRPSARAVFRLMTRSNLVGS